MLEQTRLDDNAFVRTRKLTFPVLLVGMMSGFKASVQNELNAFFAHLANQADLTRHVSVQAFSKARNKFSHLAFSKLNHQLIHSVCQHLPVPRWNGLRVVTADGSKMRMFLQDATRRAMRDVAAFALYLPGLEMTLSFQLYSVKDAERQMLFEHLDQGYPARWLIAYRVQQGIQFCMRVDETGFAAVKQFLRSGLDEQIVIIGVPKAIDCLDYGCLPLSSDVRLVKVITPQWPYPRHDDVVTGFGHLSCCRFRRAVPQPLANRR
ncbi:MAG: hypothetical protein CTY17_08995, partial [Methylomonas sp.]